MAEPETQTEDEKVASELLAEIKTETIDTDVTEDATIKSDDYESETKNEEEKKEAWTDEETKP